MPTAGDIIDEAQRDFTHRSDAECLADLQAVHDELCFDFRLKIASTTISITAGTASYTQAGRVYDARYTRSATRGDYKTLKATHKEELDEIDPRWRARENAEPEYFYMEAGNIVLHPTPDETTSGSYPRIDVDYATSETLVSGTDLPDGLMSYRVYVEGLKSRLALRVEDPRYPAYERMYQLERKRLADQLNHTAADFVSRQLPAGAITGFRRRR